MLCRALHGSRVVLPLEQISSGYLTVKRGLDIKGKVSTWCSVSLSDQPKRATNDLATRLSFYEECSDLEIRVFTEALLQALHQRVDMLRHAPVIVPLRYQRQRKLGTNLAP